MAILSIDKRKAVPAVLSKLAPATMLAPTDHGMNARMALRRVGAAALVGLLIASAGGADERAVRRAVEPAAQPSPARLLRVCADPNNLPFSNERGEGFENALAELLARDLGATVAYTWRPQRRGFVRETLRAGLCDVMLSAPTSFELVLTTAPYYRSTYVFVYRKDAPFELRSFDDPVLRDLRIGVQVIGDDYANTPPAHALGRRGITQHVVGYTVYGDYSEPNPPARIIEAVGKGDVDVAIAWGPLAGYFAPRQPVTLEIVPVAPQVDLPFLPFAFDIAVGVRRGDVALRDELDAALRRRRAEVDELLRRFGFPRLDRPRR